VVIEAMHTELKKSFKDFLTSSSITWRKIYEIASSTFQRWCHCLTFISASTKTINAGKKIGYMVSNTLHKSIEIKFLHNALL